MKVKVFQEITELPARSGGFTLGLSVGWDFGRRRVQAPYGEARELYGAIWLGFGIWVLEISVRNG